MRSQKELILRKEWDCLVILDACRYDYFRDRYKKHFSGRLKRVVSEATSTSEWAKKNFGQGKHEDIVYVSSNPLINSKCKVNGFKGRDYFFRVIDVWDTYWDENLTTVHPKFTSKATRVARAKWPNKKLISHFVQPHAPYINLGSLNAEFAYDKSRLGDNDGKKENNQIKWKKVFKKYLNRILSSFLDSIISKTKSYKVRRDMKLVNKQPIGVLAETIGTKNLRMSYTKNLDIVLEYVKELINSLPGRIVISSDHGEFLGEKGLYEHPPSLYDSKLLRAVPWLQVKKNT